MKEYVIKNGKKLRCGFTTGTCATAAAAASVQMLLSGKLVENVSVKLPKGEYITLKIGDPNINSKGASCFVKKYSGDDPDVTDGILIYADVSFNNTGTITIEGGKGVGRVTQKGLDCDVGCAAINSVPRKMITENIQKICGQFGYEGGISVIITVPDGEETAKRTFNPHLGIIGGISIIGTTGIVEPMSEQALIDSLKVEMRVIKEKGYKKLLAFPGNYAKSFIDKTFGVGGENSLKFSNYLGEILDMSVELEFEEIFIVGHIGKMVKVAGGMMNTHSHNGDFRREVIACYGASYGANQETVKELLSCITTE